MPVNMETISENSKSTIMPEEVIRQEPASEKEETRQFNYITGYRMYLITLGLSLSTFLVNLEITIVSTALVAITNDLNGFRASSWIVTAYLITYTGGLVIWAKLSDLLGRKPILLASLLTFCVFSGGCGAAQDMVQLIVCRAFQGIGGSGIYALVMVMIYELVPPPKYPMYTSLLTVLVAASFALGPIFGGLILEGTTWRWIFLLNVPGAALAALILFIAVPRDFPNQGQSKSKDRSFLKSLAAADFVGAVLMVSVLALVISGFEEAATKLSWTTATFIGPVCGAFAAMIAFLFREWHASRKQSVVEPVLPWRFFRSRQTMGLLLSSFLTGTVSITCIIEIPIRYQTAVGGTPLQAGVRLIPLSVCGPLGTMIAAVCIKNRRFPPLYASLVGQVLQILGLIFLSRGSPEDPDWHAIYGIQVVIGLGMGCCIGTAALLTPWIVEKRDIAVGSAAVTQFRFLGSALVISIITAAGNTLVRDLLADLLSPAQLTGLFRSTDSINELSPDVAHIVRGAFVQSFNLQMKIVLGFAVAGILTWLSMWQRPQIRVP